ncbi:MAG: hypothetical protein IKF99_11865 [Oscillospiraceae bacterium]|nr:hypothetical protein [Oscillospiraceae bacterium]
MAIIAALEKSVEVIEHWVPVFEQYNTPAAIQEAVEILKTHEARVLTLEEVNAYLADDDQDKNPLWVQWATDSVKGGWVLSHTVDDLVWRYKDIYGVHWVLWTQKPSDEQRKAVKWNV